MIKKTLITLTVTLLVTGCFAKSSPAKFYMLESASDGSAPVESKYGSIGVLPVNVPAYLQQPQIVTQQDSTDYKLNDFNRWLEPLSDTISNNIVNSLHASIKATDIYKFPWLNVNPELLISVNVQRFHCQTVEMKCSLTATWALSNGVTKETISSNYTSLEDELRETDYKTITETMADLLEKLTKEIVEKCK